MMVNAAGTSASPMMNTASGVTSRYGRLLAACPRLPSGDPAAGAAFTVSGSAREPVGRVRDRRYRLRDRLGAGRGGVQVRVDGVGELRVPRWRTALEHRLGRGQHGAQGVAADQVALGRHGLDGA